MGVQEEALSSSDAAGSASESEVVQQAEGEVASMTRRGVEQLQQSAVEEGRRISQLVQSQMATISMAECSAVATQQQQEW